MTKVVVGCSPEDSITHVMKLMTQRRVRHLPVNKGDQLVGIISIGDVLKHRLDGSNWKPTYFAIMPSRLDVSTPTIS